MHAKTRTAILILVALALFGLAAWAWTPDLPQAELDAKYLRQPSDRVELSAMPGVRLHMRDNGPRAGPALLLIHGFGASLHTWESWAEALSENYRVIRVDLPGSGLSPPDPRGVYTDARSEQLLLALLDQLGVSSVALVGHSISGRIAWGLAPRVRIVVAPINPRPGAAMKDESGSIRTSIQGQGCGAHAAA